MLLSILGIAARIHCHEATIRRNFLMAIDTAHMDPAGVRHQIEKDVPFKAPARGLCCFLPWCQVDNTSTGDVLWFHGRPMAWPAVFMGKLMVNRWMFGKPIFQEIHVKTHVAIEIWHIGFTRNIRSLANQSMMPTSRVKKQCHKILLMWSLTYTWCLLCVPRIYGHVWKW